MYLVLKGQIEGRKKDIEFKGSSCNRIDDSRLFTRVYNNLYSLFVNNEGLRKINLRK